jgi:hypothetical protein
MKKLILALCLFMTGSVISQNGFTTYSITIPGSGSVGSESAILIDNSGNKWVGFGNALNSSAAALGFYNNTTSTWTFYNKTNTPALPSNKVNCLAKDNAGNIWIGTQTGLVVFNGTTFTAFTTANGLPSNLITSLETVNNMIYIGTSAGLSRFDGIIFTNYNTTNTLLPFNNITAIKAESANDIWLGTTNNLIKFYINSSFTSTSFTVSTPSFTFGNVNAIHIDASGNKWIAPSADYGLIRFNNVAFDKVSSLYPNILPGNLPYAPVDVGPGPNNGIAMLAPVSGTVAGGSGSAILELLSGTNYSIYVAPNSNYNFSKYFDTDGTGTMFMTRTPIISASVTVPGMYSFSASSYTPMPGNLVSGQNFKYLDVNRVKAGILNRGDMFWDVGGSGNASYEVPKGSGVHGGFAAGLWLGGLDASNQLHTSAQTYRQNGNDFWPGPLDTISGNADSSSFVAYDKIWKIDYNDINAFIFNWNNGNIAANTYTPVADILTWPAAGTGNKTRNMAPFVDVNGDGLYNPYNGDYPDIKGDQALYFIFNDKFAPHTETGGQAFGVEVHAMAYAYGCSSVITGKNELAYTTFYNYKIYNRSNNNYHDVYAGFWTDTDIGCYTNDYIGSSWSENLGFAYNATSTDVSCAGTAGYGNYPPAAGATVLKGPLAPASDGIDNDHDGSTDEAGEECLMNVFDFYNNNIGSFPPQTTNPNNQYDYYGYLMAQWKDSTNFTCGGNAYGGTTATNFVFPQNNYPGNPCGTWTEFSAGNLSGDRRYIVSSGPFNLPAKSMIETEYAYVWSVDSTATSNPNLASLNKLIVDAQKVRNFYSQPKTNCLLTINVGIQENNLNYNFTMFPNPANSSVRVVCKEEIENVLVTDMLGRTIKSIDHLNSNEVTINVQDLSSGVYFVNVSGAGFKGTKKLIKN